MLKTLHRLVVNAKYRLDTLQKVVYAKSMTEESSTVPAGLDIKEEEEKCTFIPLPRPWSASPSISEKKVTPLVAKPSKNALRKQRRKEMEKKKRAKKQQERGDANSNLAYNEKHFGETEYYFENGLRKCYPYYFSFGANAKERWIGRTISDVYNSEFRSDSIENYNRDIEREKILVNGKKTTIDYKIKNGDKVENIVHRHEMPVSDVPIEIIAETDDLVVVNKPCSIPVHPCGRYRHNSLTFIMFKDMGYVDLRSCYRLDRLTSGVLIFAKNYRQAIKFGDQIKMGQLSKEYVARVEGEFPSGLIDCAEAIEVLNHRIGLFRCGPAGKESQTSFERLSYNGKSSVVKCFPKTGRTHQIRIHLQFLGHPIINDPLYNGDVWGPHKGRGGNFGKPIEQLVKDLDAAHTVGMYEEKEQNNAENTNACGIVKSENTNTISTEKSENIDTISAQKSENTDTNSAEPENIDTNSAVQPENIDSNTEHKDSNEPPFKRLKTEEVSTESDDPKRRPFDPSKVSHDEFCRECKTPYREPTEAELKLYLHALTYKGPGWKYSTPLPDWAEETWHE